MNQGRDEVRRSRLVVLVDTDVEEGRIASGAASAVPIPAEEFVVRAYETDSLTAVSEARPMSS